jgi:hypothetical protein
MCVLNEKKVKLIRSSTLSYKQLSFKYKVSVSTINAIISYRTWKHI